MEEELTFEEVKLLRDLAIERVEEIENQNEVISNLTIQQSYRTAARLDDGLLPLSC